jgi:hypothetical protein
MYWLYILARCGRGSEFVKKYRVHLLVHFEEFASPLQAVPCEKQLKNWHRDWKIQLIERMPAGVTSPIYSEIGARWVPAQGRDDEENAPLRAHIADSNLSPQ